MAETINLIDLYRELKRIEQTMVTKQELGKAVETIAVLSNSDTIRQINESEDDIISGRIKNINSSKDL